ncbi:MAG: hypothetical protein IRZ11_07315 [Clostridia bacterium]|nr:hypothetical protein [Clostridia bacterium]
MTADAAVAWAALLAFALSAAWTAASLLAFPRLGWTASNYRGARLPLGTGWAPAAAGAAGVALAWGVEADPLPWIVAPLAAALLGWIDDRLGSHEVRGFSAHLRALLRGRPTTGGVKLVGGGLVALWATSPFAGWTPPGWPPSPAGRLAGWLVSAGVVALAMNGLNALDLRPGRAAKGWVVAAGLALVLGARPAALAPYAAALVAHAAWDLRGRVMQGDAGSNAFGAVAGLALVASPAPLVHVAVLLALCGFHLWMEAHSLTVWLRGRPVLDWLDRLGRPPDRDPPGGG